MSKKNKNKGGKQNNNIVGKSKNPMKTSLDSLEDLATHVNLRTVGESAKEDVLDDSMNALLGIGAPAEAPASEDNLFDIPMVETKPVGSTAAAPAPVKEAKKEIKVIPITSKQPKTKLEEIESRPTTDRIIGVITDIRRSDATKQVDFIKIATEVNGKADVYLGHNTNFKPNQSKEFKLNQIVSFKPRNIVKFDDQVKSALNITIESNAEAVDAITAMIEGVLGTFNTQSESVVILSDNQIKGMMAKYALSSNTIEDLLTKLKEDDKLELVGRTTDKTPRYVFAKI